MTRIDYRTVSNSRPVVTRVERRSSNANRYNGSTVNPNSMLRDFITGLIFAAIVTICIAAAVTSCRASELYEETMVCGAAGLRMPVMDQFDETLCPVVLHIGGYQTKDLLWKNCQDAFGAAFYGLFEITTVHRQDAGTTLYLAGSSVPFITLSNSISAVAKVKPGNHAIVEIDRRGKTFGTLAGIVEPASGQLVYSNSKGRSVMKTIMAWRANNAKK